jgi:RNA 3'-terminal phosphate cyclase (ATP)
LASLIEVDGSYGEGGGQVLRTALALAAITGHGAHLYNVRARRSEPGLAPQHLTAMRAIAEVCDAEVRGDVIGSTNLVFRPRKRPHSGSYVFDVAQAAQRGSAGSVTLILQTLLLPLALAPGASHITVRGGTHVPWSPPFDYLSDVYLPTLAEIGVPARAHLSAWGFYPVGGGQITADVYGMAGLPASPDAPPILSPLTLLERGDLLRVTGTAVACNLPAHIAQRMADRARRLLDDEGLPAEVVPQLARGDGPGAFISLRAEYAGGLAGFSALGRKGMPSEEVAAVACEALLAHHATGAPVDMHLADQLVLPLALAPGRSTYRTARVEQHLLTVAEVVRQFLPVSIEVEGKLGEPGTVIIIAPEALRIEQ